MDNRPLIRRYARVERERRFLLQKMPPGIDPNDFQRLYDCFVRETSLRLRRVEDPIGNVLVVKLGQKLPDPNAPNDPTRRMLTTIYLTEAEGLALSLDGVQSVKRRFKLEEQGAIFVIDQWESPSVLSGLLLAEVECESDAELAAIQLPAWAVAEVTTDPAYSAFALASRR